MINNVISYGSKRMLNKVAPSHFENFSTSNTISLHRKVYDSKFIFVNTAVESRALASQPFKNYSLHFYPHFLNVLRKRSPRVVSSKAVSMCSSPKAVSMCSSPKAVSMCSSPKAVSMCSSPKAVSSCSSPKAVSMCKQLNL